MEYSLSFAKESVDLRRAVLSSDQKLLIIKEIVNKTLTPMQIELKYNISVKTISKWIIKYRNSVLPQPSMSARPRVIDDRSFEVIKNYYLSDPNITEKELRRFIRKESKETFQRKNLNNPEKDYKYASRRSVQRYADIVRAYY